MSTPAVIRTVSTPDGAFSIIERAGEVLASGWTVDAESLRALIHPSLRPRADQVFPGDPIGGAVDAVRAFYDGAAEAPSAVAVRQASGPFRMRAWDALRAVPAGETLSYSEFAERAGNPAAVRAAASACAMNAAALFVPCHRVLRTGGGWGGFRYGTDLKRALLDREAHRLAAV